MLIVLGPLVIFLMALFFFIGRAMARARNRNPLVWGVVCAVTSIIGFALLALMGEAEPDALAERQVATVSRYDAMRSVAGQGGARGIPAQRLATLSDQQVGPALDSLPKGVTMSQSPPPPPAATYINGSLPQHVRQGPDEATRWAFLIEYDPLAREAVEVLTPLGPEALHELRTAFFIIEDRIYFPFIKDRILEKRAGKRAPPLVVVAERSPEAQRVVAVDTGPISHEANGRPLAQALAHAAPNVVMLASADAAHAHAAAVRLARTGSAGDSLAVGDRSNRPPASGAAEHWNRPAEEPCELDGPGEPGEPGAGELDEPRSLIGSLTTFGSPTTIRSSTAAPAFAAVPANADRKQRLNGAGGGGLEHDLVTGLDERSLPPPPPPIPIESPARLSAPVREKPKSTAVTESDLAAADYLETYRGVHLFQLRDGRVYVDRFLAVFTLEQARVAVDHIVAEKSV